MKLLKIASVGFLLSALPAGADEPSLPFGNEAACHEGPLEQFGRYIGDWNIEESRLSQDGQQWSAGAGARWIFVCLGNGTAIQDFWLPADGSVGTNLRTYNNDSESWDIAWAIDSAPGYARIHAEQDADKNVVMHYIAPVQKPPRRITFFPPDEDGWNWKLEISLDGETWIEVYRIQATRRP